MKIPKKKKKKKKKNSSKKEKGQNIQELKEDIQIKNEQNRNNSIILFNKISFENRIDINNSKNLSIDNNKDMRIVEKNVFNGINSYLQRKEEFRNKIKLKPIKFRKNRRSIRNIPPIQKNIDTKENFIEPKNNHILRKIKEFNKIKK